MAKILPGLAVSKISGTIAGTTYQNWRGIIVARKKPTPTNVMSPRQLVIRSIMTLLSRAWRDDLNQGLRTAWNQRAKNYPWLDVFGNERKMTGENLYIKQNMILLDNSLDRHDTPVPDIVPPELVGFTVFGDPNMLKIKLPQVSADDVANGNFLKVDVAGGYLSKLVNVSTIVESEIQTQALPSGRKHQKSDFRLATYLPEVLATEPVDQGSVSVIPPLGWTRNCVMTIQRFNKYGNFSAPLLFSAIKTGEDI